MKSINKLMYVSLAVLALSACAERAPEVNRVQQNLVEKSIFDGEWWFTTTAIDVSYDETFVFNTANAFAPFSGSMSTDYAIDFNRGGPSVLGSPTYSFPIARVRFVIDENYLFAYRSYELVAGGNDNARAKDYLGQPLAVFKIEDHVEIRRDYDEVTGETTNVTTENTTDLKWYDRKYMRVDWSRNLLGDFSANDVQANELFTQFRRESIPFFVQEDPKSDFPQSYQPQFVRVKDDKDYSRKDEFDEEDADKVHYMSFVTQEAWSPRGSCLTTGGLCASATATMRNSFLRVPPKHEYAALTETNNEFDRFGLFRSHQPSYARGGADKAVQRKHCVRDADCGPSAACDTADRRIADCKAQGKDANCRAEQNICVGGLTSDQGETDFLNFFVSRLNLYSDSLTDQTCQEDWECDGRYADTCKGQDAATCKPVEGSQCDLAAKRCTLPLDKRKVRPVSFRLTPNFPPYLVRRAFDAIGQWNEALMRGQRAARGILPFDQARCGASGDEVCTTDLSKDAKVACQQTDPTAYCFCGSPEDTKGMCRMGYDPFESPAAAKARGIPNPYDCYISGPADLEHPTNYEDYDPAQTYGYEFKGTECMLTLKVNSCDRDAKQPCEDLGDLRHNFLSHLQHGGANFGGVAQPLSDPKSGELIVASATMAAESIENVGTQASQFFPVLRGDVPEDSYFSGENLRGYFARLGKVEHPVATVPANSSGNEIEDPSRPGSREDEDAIQGLQDRMQRVAAKVAKLKGTEGRTAIFSGRKNALAGKSVDVQLSSAITEALKTPPRTTVASSNQNMTLKKVSAVDAPFTELEQERRRRQDMASRNMDVFEEPLYNSQYNRYFAEAFKGRTTAEASLRFQQAYFRGVTLHEIGHVLGLRHNFAGSLDRNNYPDAYFDITKQSPLPNILEYDDPARGGNNDGRIVGEEAQNYARAIRAAREERLKSGAGNVMTASIMDYNANFSDFAGLGRYDRAAAAFAYFGKVEAYQTGDPTLDPSLGPPESQPVAFDSLERPDMYRRALWSYYRGGEACQSDADCPNRAGRNVTAFQAISQRCVLNPRLPAAANGCAEPGQCVCSNFYDDFDAYESGQAYRGRTEAPKFAPVKYLYCHDNRTGDLSWCSTSDAGESFQEVVEHYRRSWRERYPRAYFRNFKASGPAKGASYDTVVEAVKIYQHMFFRQSFEGAEYQQSIAPLGYVDQLFASASTLDWLTEIIGAPDVGSYKLDEKENIYRQISSEPGAEGSDLDLEVGEGFYLWSQYQTGQNGFFRLERAGTFLDKLLAIQAITKRDWGLQYQVDEFYYVNFFDVFQKEVIDLFGGLISRNPKQYAPRVIDGKLTYLSSFRMDNRNFDRGNTETTYPQSAVDGTDTEVLRDIATIEALSEFPVYYDTSFEQRLLVFKLGSGDGYKIPAKRKDGTDTCKFGDDKCDKPDYIVYDSDRLHTSYVAVVVDPEETGKIDEQQVAYQLLRGLTDRQNRLRELKAKDAKTADETDEFARLVRDVERDESFLEYLIELERQLGISSYFF
ncbi:MAG TPA: zinc-dependent metalloprotease [Polyangiales bacterium]|nr:zinc-dependent metalloprotease [Polyangiales bacterium]